jgi:hypothetical protein
MQRQGAQRLLALTSWHLTTEQGACGQRQSAAAGR